MGALSHGGKPKASKSGSRGIKNQRKEIQKISGNWVQVNVEYGGVGDTGRGMRWISVMNKPHRKFITRITNPQSNTFRRRAQARIAALGNAEFNRRFRWLCDNGRRLLATEGTKMGSGIWDIYISEGHGEKD